MIRHGFFVSVIFASPLFASNYTTIMNIPEKLWAVVREGAGACIDTRVLQKGNVFFALPGEKTDGHRFVNQALEKGAGAVVISDPEFKLNDRCFVTEDVLGLMQETAREYRKEIGPVVLAITGSNGKTTNKNLLHLVLKRKYRVFSTQGNFNNHIGVPLTLFNTPADTEILVLEMGTNHFGEIRALCEIGLPDYGSILNIGKSHLEFLGSEAGVLKAKAELADFLEQHGGRLFLNREEKSLKPLLQHPVEKIIFDRHDMPGEPVMKMKIERTVPHIAAIIVAEGKTADHLHSELWGEHNARNLIHAAAVGLYFEVSPTDIAEALSEYRPENNRSQIIEYRGVQIYMDAYNANPTSMRLAITAFSEIYPSGGALVLGDMGELGETELAEHRAILFEVASHNFEKVFLVGSLFARAGKEKFRQFEYFRNAEELQKEFAALLDGKTCPAVLIKGSRSMTLEKLL